LRVVAAAAPSPPASKSFLLLFFKKEALSSINTFTIINVTKAIKVFNASFECPMNMRHHPTS
jgi:hypothetical protein